MKKIIKLGLCAFMLFVFSGCGSEVQDKDYSKVFEQMKTDGFNFNYSYEEMVESDAKIYYLLIMPNDFSLTDSSYLYYSDFDYSDETKEDVLSSIVYHTQDGEIYSVIMQGNDRRMYNDTCSVNYNSMEPLEDIGVSCEDTNIENMEFQKENIVKFLEQYDLSYDDMPKFYEWYAENYKDTATKGE